MGKATGTDPSQNTVFEGGKEQYKDDAVEVRTGVTASTIDKPVADPVKACADPSKKPYRTDGITIKVKCKKDPHVVQFIYREILDKDGKAISKEMKTTGGTYQTTTDPAKPNWNTDSAARPDPSYEAGGMHRKDDDALTTFDQPGFNTDLSKPPPGGTSRATFKAYAYCDGKVIREINWVREQKDGADPTYTASAQKADALPDWASKQLKTNGYNAGP